MKMAPDLMPNLEALTRKLQNLQVGVRVRSGLSPSQGQPLGEAFETMAICHL